MSEDDPEAWAREKEEIAHAWQQPAFSRETIEVDQWTAVYLSIPENASRELLEHAHGWAADLERYAEHDGAFVRPMAGPFEDRTQQENVEAARARVEVLGGVIGELALQEPVAVERKLPPDPEAMNDARAEWAAASIRHFQVHTGTDWEDAPSDLLGDLMHFCDRNGFDFEHELRRARSHYEAETLGDEAELQPDLFAESQPVRQAAGIAEKLTLEAIERDPLNAVMLPLPDDASVDLLAAVYFTAARVDRDYFERYEDAETAGEAKSAADLSRDAGVRAEFALNRLTADHRAEAISIRDGEAAEVAPEAPVRGFFSVWGAAENLAERASRVVDITLGAVIGFFVDEPKMTAAQVHDTLQAADNVETVHAREVAAAEAIEAGAHETRMLEMKGGQQEHDLRLAMTLGTNATAEANIGLDEHEGARRTQKFSL